MREDEEDRDNKAISSSVVVIGWGIDDDDDIETSDDCEGEEEDDAESEEDGNVELILRSVYNECQKIKKETNKRRKNMEGKGRGRDR